MARQPLPGSKLLEKAQAWGPVRDRLEITKYPAGPLWSHLILIFLFPWLVKTPCNRCKDFGVLSHLFPAIPALLGLASQSRRVPRGQRRSTSRKLPVSSSQVLHGTRPFPFSYSILLPCSPPSTPIKTMRDPQVQNSHLSPSAINKVIFKRRRRKSPGTSTLPR